MLPFYPYNRFTIVVYDESIQGDIHGSTYVPLPKPMQVSPTVPTFNSYTKCEGKLGVIHNRMPDGHAVSFWHVIHLGVCTNRHWQTSGRPVQELNVRTVSLNIKIIDYTNIYVSRITWWNDHWYFVTKKAHCERNFNNSSLSLSKKTIKYQIWVK